MSKIRVKVRIILAEIDQDKFPKILPAEFVKAKSLAKKRSMVSDEIRNLVSPFVYANFVMDKDSPLLKYVPKNALICSMSAVGHCGDNPACEGFFGVLKRKRVYQ
jgi:hypothetical protein